MALNPDEKYTMILAKFLLNLVLWGRIKTVCIAIQQYMLLTFFNAPRNLWGKCEGDLLRIYPIATVTLKIPCWNIIAKNSPLKVTFPWKMSQVAARAAWVHKPYLQHYYDLHIYCEFPFSYLIFLFQFHMRFFFLVWENIFKYTQLCIELAWKISLLWGCEIYL